MSWRTIHLSDRPATPWRNGGGLTRELVASPEQSDWRWRMSVAEVTASGPFSRFDGVTRWFAVLRGAGVDLRVASAPGSEDSVSDVHRLTVEEPPFCFDGSAATACQLIAGPTQDFNLMVHDSNLPARMVRVRGELRELAHDTKTIAVYAVDSGASVSFNSEELYIPPATLVWRTLAKSATVQIRSTHALWMEFSA